MTKGRNYYWSSYDNSEHLDWVPDMKTKNPIYGVWLAMEIASDCNFTSELSDFCKHFRRKSCCVQIFRIQKSSKTKIQHESSLNMPKNVWIMPFICQELACMIWHQGVFLANLWVAAGDKLHPTAQNYHFKEFSHLNSVGIRLSYVHVSVYIWDGYLSIHFRWEI